MKFYLVSCVRGHCGRGNSSIISFAFMAENCVDAMDMAKSMPSVKHSRMCLNAREITEEDYWAYRSVSAYERTNQWAASSYRGKNWRGAHKKGRK